jgi:hypothetical protein
VQQKAISALVKHDGTFDIQWVLEKEQLHAAKASPENESILLTFID